MEVPSSVPWEMVISGSTRTVVFVTIGVTMMAKLFNMETAPQEQNLNLQ